MARTILVVEDETTLRETLADALDAEGFRVVQAADGRGARARVPGDPPAQGHHEQHLAEPHEHRLGREHC